MPSLESARKAVELGVLWALVAGLGALLALPAEVDPFQVLEAERQPSTPAAGRKVSQIQLKTLSSLVAGLGLLQSLAVGPRAWLALTAGL